MNKEFWNERYDKGEFIYGKMPNVFFAQELKKLEPGKILLLGDGEGRNSVYAASQGWEADAVDFSKIARDKALKLAEENSVSINYHLSDILEFKPKHKYDCVALIYLHFSGEERERLHKFAQDCLNLNGVIILEAFDKDQIKFSSGGPKNLNALYSLEEIFTDFQDFDIKFFSKETVELNESQYHEGMAAVVRFVGIKA